MGGVHTVSTITVGDIEGSRRSNNAFALSPGGSKNSGGIQIVSLSNNDITYA